MRIARNAPHLLAAAASELGELEGHVIGVGPITAAASTAAWLATHRPTAVLLVGTAGAYPSGPDIGEVITASELGWEHGVALQNQGYVPAAPEPIRPDSALLDRLDLPRHAVVTVGAITTDPSLCELLETRYTVEHMEAYAVATACRSAGVPFGLILGIANRVGPDAHTQWMAHHDAVEQAVREVAGSFLASFR